MMNAPIPNELHDNAAPRPQQTDGDAAYCSIVARAALPRPCSWKRARGATCWRPRVASPDNVCALTQTLLADGVGVGRTQMSDASSPRNSLRLRAQWRCDGPPTRILAHARGNLRAAHLSYWRLALRPSTSQRENVRKGSCGRQRIEFPASHEWTRWGLSPAPPAC